MSPKTKTIYSNAWLCQNKSNTLSPLFCDFIVENGKIRDIIKKDFYSAMKHAEDGEHTKNDLAGRFVTPPVVNFHEHFYSRLAKGLNISGSMSGFQNILHNLWWKLDRILDQDLIRASAQMACIESIKSGASYIFDHHASPFETEGSLSVIMETMDDFNLNGVLCFETSDRNGAEYASKALEENFRFFNENSNDNFKSLLGLHASFTISDDTLQEAAKLIKENDLGIHIHLCEDVCDRKLSYEFAEVFPVQRLKENELLNYKSILAHGIFLTEEDYTIISDKGCAIVYNPDSNLNNSVGLPDYNIVPSSIPILTGTDGMNANVSGSLKRLFLLARHQGFSFDEAFFLVKKIYFDQYNFIKRYFPDFTNLEINNNADFVIWDYIPPTPVNNDNIWGHIIYGLLDSRPKSVINNGQYLMKDFKIVSQNEDRVYNNIISQGERLYQLFN